MSSPASGAAPPSLLYPRAPAPPLHKHIPTPTTPRHHNTTAPRAGECSPGHDMERMFEGIEALNAAASSEDLHAEATEAKQQKDVEVSE